MDTLNEPITPHPITVAELFRQAGERLQLSWVAGRSGGAKVLDSDTIQKPTLALMGHLNYVHPNRVQVMGCAEMDYLRGLSPSDLALSITNLFSTELAALVVANGESVPDGMIAAAERSATPLFTSTEQSPALMRLLSHIMAQALAPSTIMHGVFLEVSGVGVLITGDPAVGKSELALELISRGHRLVADDVLEVFAVSPDTLEGRCPVLLQDFMEVRGLGVLNIRRLFGETAVKHKKNLKLIIHLSPADTGKNPWQEIDRLNMAAGSRVILGIEVAEVRIPVAVGRNLAVLVEVAVRNHTLKMRGIQSSEEFADRQRIAIAASE
ncbi:MAG: HPr kinase/phosphorylase [Hydrogenophilales bacterium CG17_big_fil_post_rev_8_21_14_2_50_63_12]|nr:MAG: HPr kinase/phosphorylase [Hydrogenophilales bacterium CG17_big_fil_post_rev_8_21_14_2_50_63_12]PIX98132.1 MAG: HPr kinase/phosphorylase [Hydrogenophilales bacterium CG_4_10_14_3_um_filter_63_21]PJB05601.1 MAG: HPr kinase/phosphorylase [Hydrogenophilales bacterium CG_4_9_14_3_um_filter_63_34]